MIANLKRPILCNNKLAKNGNFFLIVSTADLNPDRPFLEALLAPELTYHLYAESELTNVPDASSCQLMCILTGPCTFYVHVPSTGKCLFGTAPVNGATDNGLGFAALSFATSIYMESSK